LAQGRQRQELLLTRWLALLALLVAPSACDGGAESPGSGGSSGGDSGAPLSVQAILFSAEGAGWAPLEPGGALELWAAPQGGHWARIGARARGLGTDTAELAARLYDPGSSTPFVEATRTAPMVVAKDDPTLAQPDPSDMYHYVHLPLCPGEGGRALNGGEFRLVVTVTELYGDFSEGSVALDVRPTCQQPAGATLSFCTCECAAAYAPGKCSGG